MGGREEGRKGGREEGRVVYPIPGMVGTQSVRGAFPRRSDGNEQISQYPNIFPPRQLDRRTTNLAPGVAWEKRGYSAILTQTVCTRAAGGSIAELMRWLYLTLSFARSYLL